MTPNFVLDKATILERLGGDEEIFAVLADMFLQDWENYTRDLDAAVAAGDGVRLRREAHTVKGVLATLADEEGAALAAELESRAKGGEATTSLAGMVADLQGRLRVVAAVVRQVRQQG